ncbi:DUF2948 family protein [Paenochrobactrum sp. BZR 588]|uniref:DUF2948 family protein n=1 Tax=Paenochrobactrum TaxID=999488 RepID=UPI0035BC340B
MLKLMALDQEDLQIISAHLQDAVLKTADIQYLHQEKRFILTVNRFVWEGAQSGFKLKLFGKRSFERRRTSLHFNRVLSVKTNGINRDNEQSVLSLLSVNFIETEAPHGVVELIFAGGNGVKPAIRLDVECIEAQITDLGPAWETNAKPKHGV